MGRVDPRFVSQGADLVQSEGNGAWNPVQEDRPPVDHDFDRLVEVHNAVVEEEFHPAGPAGGDVDPVGVARLGAEEPLAGVTGRPLDPPGDGHDSRTRNAQDHPRIPLARPLAEPFQDLGIVFLESLVDAVRKLPVFEFVAEIPEDVAQGPRAADGADVAVAGSFQQEDGNALQVAQQELPRVALGRNGDDAGKPVGVGAGVGDGEVGSQRDAGGNDPVGVDGEPSAEFRQDRQGLLGMEDLVGQTLLGEGTGRHGGQHGGRGHDPAGLSGGFFPDRQHAAGRPAGVGRLSDRPAMHGEHQRPGPVRPVGRGELDQDGYGTAFRSGHLDLLRGEGPLAGGSVRFPGVPAPCQQGFEVVHPPAVRAFESRISAQSLLRSPELLLAARPQIAAQGPDGQRPAGGGRCLDRGQGQDEQQSGGVSHAEKVPPG